MRRRLAAMAILGLLTGCGGGGAAPDTRQERAAAPGLTRTLPRAFRDVCRSQAAGAPVGARTCPPLIPTGPLKVLYRGRSLGRDSPPGGFSADLASRSLGRLHRRRIETNGGHWRYDVVWAPRVRRLAIEKGIVRPVDASRPSRCRQARIAGRRVRSCRVAPYREGGGVNGGHIAYVWEHDGVTFAISVHGYANEPRARAMMAALIATVEG
jgi:hypothetical protein